MAHVRTKMKTGIIYEEKYRKIVDGAPRFLVKCREVLFKIKDEEIDDIRKRMKI